MPSACADKSLKIDPRSGMLKQLASTKNKALADVQAASSQRVEEVEAESHNYNRP